MPLSAWKQVAARTWKESSKDNIGIVSAGVAFYGFLALVPLLGAIVLTYGIIADPQTVVANVKSMTGLMPQDVAKLIGQQLMGVVHSSGSKKGFGLVIAIAVALFGARNAAGSIITALNIAYEEEEKRSFLRVNLLSLAITAGAVALAVVALIAISALGYLEKLFPNVPGYVTMAGKILSYLLLVLGGAAAAATLYRYGPDRKKAKWEWITPGSIFAAVLWLVLTLGFGFYVAHFGSYGKTYGSLATVVILLTWMYLSAYVLLFGAELNSELEHQTAKDTTQEAPQPLGSRRAWAADHVAAGENKAGEAASDELPKAGKERSGPGAVHTSTHPQTFSPGPDFVASRATNRAGVLAGLQPVGIAASVISTVGLALLRKRGREAVGAALVASAAGLSLMKRGG
jgi:membrane protein